MLFFIHNCCGRNANSCKIVNCCFCRKSYKIECVDLTNAEARKIHQKSGLSWSCKNCAKIGSDINSLKAVIVALQEEIKVLKLSVSTVPPSTAASASLFQTEKVIQEVSERNKRKCNIIIYGRSELINKNKTEQSEADTVFVKDVLTALNIGDLGYLKPIRLGKYDPTKQDRRRPIKITLSSEEDVVSVLRASKSLKTTDPWKNIFISRDRTKMQNELYKSVRNELHERLSNGEQNLIIKYKDGIPNIVHSEN